jgi:Tol biopolymer transport system component
MTTGRRLDTRLHSIIGEIAQGPYPDYIDDVLAGTARKRQRPRWTFPERWLPMDIAAQPLQNSRRSLWRGLTLLALLALLVIALVGALILVGGSSRVAPPFGRAANGLVAFAAGGDIKTVDPATSKVTTLITGPGTTLAPVYSRDGTKMVFFRDPGTLFVARSDGTGLVSLTPAVMPSLGGWSFSADGRSVIATVMAAGRPTLLIVPSDGSAAPRLLDVGLTDSWASHPQYRPNGSEILFVGEPNGSHFQGVHAVDPATGVIRTIVQGSLGAEAFEAAWSPDGSRVVYGMSHARGPDVSAWTHVVAADGTGDMRLAAPDDVLQVAGLAWSNDGTRLVVVEHTTQAPLANRSAVVWVDGTGPRVELDCAHGGFDCSGNFRAWSPDDSALIGSVDEGGIHYLADPVTGRIRRAAWGGAGEPAWQRLAP